MKHSLVAALSALLLSAGLAWADDTAPAATQISGVVTNVDAAGKIITVSADGALGGSKSIGIQDQVPPPKKGGGDQVPLKGGGDQIPLKGGETPIQDQGQVPPPKKGSKDLADPSQVIDQSQVPPPKKGGKDVTDPGQVIDQSQVPPPKKGSKDLIEPSQDQSQGQVPPPKKGSKAVCGASSVSLLCDDATSIKMGDKAVGFDALQIGQNVLVNYAPLSLVGPPAVVPGKNDQTPPSKTDPVPGKNDQTPPSKDEPVPGKTDQTPPSKTDQVPPPSKDEPVPGKTDQTPPSKTDPVPGKKEGKAGPGKVQFHAISILIMPQEPIQTQKQGPVPSKEGKQEPPSQVPQKGGAQIQIQQQAPVPAK